MRMALEQKLIGVPFKTALDEKSKESACTPFLEDALKAFEECAPVANELYRKARFATVGEPDPTGDVLGFLGTATAVSDLAVSEFDALRDSVQLYCALLIYSKGYVDGKKAGSKEG
jgi:hypothetical protein